MNVSRVTTEICNFHCSAARSASLPGKHTLVAPTEAQGLATGVSYLHICTLVVPVAINQVCQSTDCKATLCLGQVFLALLKQTPPPPPPPSRKHPTLKQKPIKNCSTFIAKRYNSGETITETINAYCTPEPFKTHNLFSTRMKAIVAGPPAYLLSSSETAKENVKVVI